MVAIVAGNGLGLLNTSLNILGEAGVLGQRVLGQGSSRAFVNAVSGNLVLQMQDEQLAGGGLDLYALRTYNALGTLNDGDGDGWRWGYEQTVRFQGPGTPSQPQAGATVIRTAGDGHVDAVDERRLVRVFRQSGIDAHSRLLIGEALAMLERQVKEAAPNRHNRMIVAAGDGFTGDFQRCCARG